MWIAAAAALIVNLVLGVALWISRKLGFAEAKSDAAEEAAKRTERALEVMRRPLERGRAVLDRLRGSGPGGPSAGV